MHRKLIKSRETETRKLIWGIHGIALMSNWPGRFKSEVPY